MKTTPDDHFAASPHRGVTNSCSRCVHGVSGRPTIGAGVISTACVENAAAPAPDNHLAAGPYGGVLVSCGRHGIGTSSRPTIGARIVSSAGVEQGEEIVSAPHDHLTPSPHCCMKTACVRRVARTCRCPTI